MRFSTHNFSEFGYRCSRESQAYALVTLITTGDSLNIVFFPQNVVLFLNSANSTAALVFYLPGVCMHTDTEGKQSPDYFKILGKNTIFNV